MYGPNRAKTKLRGLRDLRVLSRRKLQRLFVLEHGGDA
jgi:hypothetical protein